MKKITSTDYYRQPTINHETGDIWNSLPTFGLLKQAHCSGLVITPACDLANSKVETLTYLPILNISEMLVSRMFYPVVRGILINLVNNLSAISIKEFLLKNYLPSEEEVTFLIKEFEDLKAKNQKKNEGIDRVILGLKITQDIINAKILTTDKSRLNFFLGNKEFEKICIALVKNSYSSDLHYLPKDNEDPDWSSVPLHSCVLFRYPITAPIEIFELANDLNCIDWQAKMTELQKTFSIAEYFKDAKPLKSSKLDERFLSDLLTRYGNLYLRIGSPDFDDETVKRTVIELLN